MTLTEQQTDMLRRWLDARAVDLQTELDEDLARSAAMKRGDCTWSAHQAQMCRDARELLEVGLALQRMDEGSYGVCIDCYVEIEYRLLQARPTASRCALCQQRHDGLYMHA